MSPTGLMWNISWDQFHYWVFHRNSNSMEISFHSHLDSDTVITTKFCTWHDSCAVVACAKSCCDLYGQQRTYGKATFPSNLNCGQKTVSETGPRARDFDECRWQLCRLPQCRLYEKAAFPLHGWQILGLKNSVICKYLFLLRPSFYNGNPYNWKNPVLQRLINSSTVHALSYLVKFESVIVDT